MDPDPESPGPCLQTTEEETAAAPRFRPAAFKGQGQEKVGEEPRESSLQVEKSEKRMFDLQHDVTNIVTNIQIAADAKESMRRTELEEARKLRVEQLENDIRSSQKKFLEITRGWLGAKMKEIPQELQESLNSQQQLCAQLLEGKRKLISDLQQELKMRDDRFVKDLRKQAEEVDLMIEEMDNQVKLLTKAYREELAQIESAHQQEREALLTRSRDKWEQFRQELRDKELSSLSHKTSMVEENEAMINKLWVENAAVCKNTKKKLESELQIKRVDLQKKAASYLLKEAELSQKLPAMERKQKELTKQMRRLQSELKSLKMKRSNQEKRSKEGHHILSERFKCDVHQYEDQQRRMKHFAAIDAQKFQEIWLMNDAEVTQLMERALAIDCTIYKQLLGLPWERPQTLTQSPPCPAASPLTLTGQTSLGGQQQIFDASTQTEAGSISTGGATLWERSGHVLSDSDSNAEGEEVGEVSMEMMKKLVDLLYNEAFQRESAIPSVLGQNTILHDLGIRSEDDLRKLTDFLLEYTQQQREQAEDVSELGESSKMAEEVETNSTTDPTCDFLHPNHVLPALKKFIQLQARESSVSHQPSFCPTAAWDHATDKAYWESKANVISEDKVKLWGTVESILKKYHEVLAEANELIHDTQGLQQQNTELRMLLQQSLNSRVIAKS